MKLNVPYFSEKTKVAVQNEIVEIKAYQIIVWVSISNRVFSSWNSKLLKFPAILDVGTTHNFALTKDHLLDWGGFHSDDLPQIGKNPEGARKRASAQGKCLASRGQRTIRVGRA